MKLRLASAAALLLAASIAAPAFAQSAGADTYKAKCAMCHGPDGAGNTPVGRAMRLRSLKSPEDVKASDADLFKDTKSGVGKMQGYAGKLTDAQITDVVAYIRTLQK